MSNCVDCVIGALISLFVVGSIVLGAFVWQTNTRLEKLEQQQRCPSCEYLIDPAPECPFEYVNPIENLC